MSSKQSSTAIGCSHSWRSSFVSCQGAATSG